MKRPLAHRAKIVCMAGRPAWSWLLALQLGAAQAQWLPVEAAAVAPLPAAQAASWPEAVLAGSPAPTRSLSGLLGLMQPKPPLETPHWPDAAALRSRVADAVKLAAPAAFARSAEGQFVEQADRDDAADALADTITTALHQAGHGPRAAPADRVAAETRGLLRALHDARALDEARAASLAGRPPPAGAPAATLADVDGVRLLEPPSQPATLWLLLKPATSRPQGLVARVNLDEVLARVSRRVH